MFKVWSLQLRILIKKGIAHAYPWAVSGREWINWGKICKVSLAFLAYPLLTFLLAISGVEAVARFMISPFSPSDKANVWFFFMVALVPLLLPLVSAVMYWLPAFFRSRFAIPFFKAALITLLISPFVYLFWVFAQYIFFAIVAVTWLLSGGGAPTENPASRRLDPWTDVQHPEYLSHNDD